MRIKRLHLRIIHSLIVVTSCCGHTSAICVEARIAVYFHDPRLLLRRTTDAVDYSAEQIDGAGYKEHYPPLLCTLKM